MNQLVCGALVLAINIADFERRAKAYLPRILYDWVAGGAEEERGLRASVDAFSQYRLVPRYGAELSLPSLQTSLFGRLWGRPFGIAPTGYTGLLRPGGESMMRAAASAADIPFILSGVSVAAVDAVAAEEPGRTWFQIYPALDHSITLDVASRARDSGVSVLVVTMDMPREAKRERDWRNGFTLPLHRGPRLLWDGMTHPRFTARYLASGGLPTLGTWRKYLPAGASASDVLRFHVAQSYPRVTWRHVEDYRRLWPGPLVVKGLLHPEDVTKARSLGVDGVVLSNHGGRQLDRGITTLNALPAVRAAVGPEFPLMLDGGIRRGADVAIALALGANFVFCGRAILWGLVSDGEAGAHQAIEILTDELSRLMSQIGVADIAGLTPAVFAESVVGR